MLDSGLLGGLIGAGCMACIVFGGCCYERKERFVEWWRRKRALHQPLLPVTSANPVLVRSGSKQWKMKELVGPK
jgi:hypothetical protein